MSRYQSFKKLTLLIGLAKRFGWGGGAFDVTGGVAALAETGAREADAEGLSRARAFAGISIRR
jgi:hypothetical protein